ncbi:CD3337/EF1877 family mobilome membrane protein [Desmospora activa]|uniref:TrbL/VirB6 plasmid conjugal transfer protein n=1 Tax=Desmospora activa DSM 45169 TaxID=1121389 RepID=A0A2T4YZ03_9BACL|nr:type IV secretion system protein [Desmospora activa]PTM52180.1 TrbL/VirB6 plasmid conjugal transfer protein [Desmospora activa DSM 45169]
MKKKILILLAILATPLVLSFTVAAIASDDFWGDDDDGKRTEEYRKKQEEEELKRRVGEGDMPNDLDAYNELQEKEKEKKEEKEAEAAKGEPDDFVSPAMQQQLRELGDGQLTAYDYMIYFPEERLEYVEETLNYPILYNDYYPSQYSLELILDDTYWWELKDTASNTGHFFFHQWVNTLWQYLVVFNFQVISYVENAFANDIVDSLANVVGASVQEIAGFSNGSIGDSGLWGELFTFFIVLAGAWAAYMFMIKRATTKAASGLGLTILVMVLALALFSNASGVMKYPNDISSGLSQEILGIGINLVPNSEQQIYEAEQRALRGIESEEEKEIPKEAVSFLIADRLYYLLIYEPYLLLQYGKTSSDITWSRSSAILQHKVMSEQRADAVKKEVSKDNPYDDEPTYMMTTAGTFERLAVVILLWTTHIILGISLLIMAGAILFYQLLFIILTLFAPIALLLALIPAWTYVAMNWFQKWVGAILMKLILSVFLTIILAISQVLYNTTPPSEYGYIWTITLQLLLVIGVLWKRKDIFNILRAPIRGIEQFPGENRGAGGVIRAATRYVERGYRYTKGRGRQDSRSRSARRAT